MTECQLFEFDEIDADLALVPLGARRVLDHLGAKLSLEGWRSLALVDRTQLLRLGSGSAIDADAAREILKRATPLPRATDPIGDPPDGDVPPHLLAVLGRDRPIPIGTWQGLSPLERWVLDKVSKSKNHDRLPRAYDEIIRRGERLTHLDGAGQARMVGTTDKAITTREAVAGTFVSMSADAHRALIDGNAKKGDVLGTARIAGIMAAKQTSQLIPLCHPIHLTRVDIKLTPATTGLGVDVEATVTAVDRTGVEMEAMVAASVAALTIYDMLKAVDRSMVIGPTRLLAKSGGRSGEYRA